MGLFDNLWKTAESGGTDGDDAPRRFKVTNFFIGDRAECPDGDGYVSQRASGGKYMVRVNGQEEGPYWPDEMRLIEGTRRPFTTSTLTRQCSHRQAPLQAGIYTVRLSASSDRVPWKGDAPLPLTKAAVYMTPIWFAKPYMGSNDGSDTLRKEGEQRVLFIDWPDQGVIPMATLERACAWALAALKRGDSLDIGCQGGHGRTGTFAGALAVYLGENPHLVIKRIRKDYCNKAIETKRQEDLIVEFSDHLKGRK
jgi:hypothetical protein